MAKGTATKTEAATVTKPTLDLSLVQNPFQVEEAEATAAAPKRARNEVQTAMDAVVAAVYERWVAAGKPKTWAATPTSAKAKYAVNPEEATAYRGLITKSAEYEGHRARIGDPVQCNPETCGTCARIRQALEADQANPETETLSDEDFAAKLASALGGHEVIVFTIIDKRPRKPNENGGSN